MKRCKNCILPETFPGIKFNKEGICNFCLEYRGTNILNEKKEVYRNRFEKLIKKYKVKNSYDALMCYSGGKDSTYTLSILKEKYNLNVLAITYDNGFLSESAIKNAKNVMDNLKFDYIIFKPRSDLLIKIFNKCSEKNIYSQKTIERASTICTSCMGIIRFSALRIALEKNIPFITFGWSPGQAPITSSIMKNNPQMIQMTQEAIYRPMHKIVGDELNPYFLEKKHFSGSYNFPYNISPLAFLDYDEKKIYQKISKLGWKAPKDTDANSTNCLINSYAIQVHKNQFKFHPYAFELGKLVREGYMDRETALTKINKSLDEETIKLVKNKLGVQ